jgi:23S rRNA (cytosine1962-C5)-methyltransferase
MLKDRRKYANLLRQKRFFMLIELYDEVKKNLSIRSEDSEAMRLFHGRGKCFSILPNINIDYFPSVVVIMQYRDDDTNKNELLNSLIDLLPKETSFYWQNRYLPRATWELLKGEQVENSIVKELKAKYKITFLKNQNLGLFLDMKEGRKLVSKLAPNKKVLNLFSYTCPFSVVALLNNANSVVNMDMSKGVLTTGRENHQLNNIDLNKVKFLSHDIFKSFGKLKKNGPYDLIIADPPSDQGKSFKLENNYPKLIRRLPDLMLPEADILLCINSPFYNSEFLIKIANEECPQLVLQDIYYSPLEFLEEDKEQGVKILHFKNIS